MINNYSNFVKYTGLGNTNKYSFPFKITNINQIRILVFNTLTDELVVSQKADEGGFVASATFNINKAGGEITLANNLALDRELIIKLSMNEGLQPYQYREQDDFRLRHFENGLDHVILHVQRLYEKFTRVLGFDEKLSYHETFNPTLDTPVEVLPKSYIRTNVDGNGIELREFYGDVVDVVRGFIEEGGGGVPQGGETHAILEKKSDDDGDADWTNPLVYKGFTERWNELVDLSGVKATLDYIMNMGYAPPNVSLSGSVSTALREKGDIISSVNLTANIVRTLNDIVTVRFYRGGTLLDTQTSGGSIPSGGSNSFNVATPFSDNTSFSVQVDDNSAQSKPSRTAGITYSFVYPYYFGVGAAGLGAAVSGLTKDIITSNANLTKNFSPNGTQKMYFAYPASYGALTKIYDVNNFDTILDWTRTTVNITGLDATAQSYYVYEFNNYAVSGTYPYRFVR